MSWFTGGKQAEAKRLVAQLADLATRDRAARDLVRLDADALPALLGRIGDPRAIEPLGMALYDLHHDVGKASAEALARFGAASFEVLVEALEHPEMWIRIHSVDVLPKVKEPRVALVLLEMLKDPEREVRKHVIEAMGELKDGRTLPALQEIMANRADRELAALAKQAIRDFTITS
jgi:HEAT repeat protein